MEIGEFAGVVEMKTRIWPRQGRAQRAPDDLGCQTELPATLVAPEVDLVFLLSQSGKPA
jgi:hypothetical protein